MKRNTSPAHVVVLTCALLVVFLAACQKSPLPAASVSDTLPADFRAFQVKGVVQELKPDGKTAVIKHEAIANFMEAMTMPFKVKEPKELGGIRAGDEVTFRLVVGPDESWIDRLAKTGKSSTPPAQAAPAEPQVKTNATFKITDFPDFAFTNELSQPVSLRQFKGQAVALTFFFTRCPIPEYCPRLSKNFEEASQKLGAMPNAPTNWHLVSISFDPRDTPEVLHNYALRYHYDAQHWSLLTGSPEHIEQLTRGLGMPLTKDGEFYNHGFRTMVFDATGQLHAQWPFGGDFTDILVAEIVAAANTTDPH